MLCQFVTEQDGCSVPQTHICGSTELGRNIATRLFVCVLCAFLFCGHLCIVLRSGGVQNLASCIHGSSEF